MSDSEAAEPPPSAAPAGGDAAPARPLSTLCITHSECLSHINKPNHPEQAERVTAVMRAIRELDGAVKSAAPEPNPHPAPFSIVELETSPAMLGMLESQLLPTGELTSDKVRDKVAHMVERLVGLALALRAGGSQK